MPQVSPLLAANLHRLVCPVCHAALALVPQLNPAAINCTGCRRSYPIVDGLPVLLATRATLQTESSPMSTSEPEVQT